MAKAAGEPELLVYLIYSKRENDVSSTNQELFQLLALRCANYHTASGA
jgi:hypothetical protein